MKLLIPVILTAMLAPAAAQTAYSTATALSSTATALKDTVAAPKDTVAKTRNNTAKGLNALQYVMEGRYLPHGDRFTRRWDDHLFIEAGAGVEQMVPPGSGYRFSPLTSVHIGVGKQLNRLHSLRLIAHGAFGYQQDKDVVFTKMGGRIDHLFSLSSYFNGYNPSRLLDVSTVLGAGAQHSRLKQYGLSGMSYFAHMGLQLRFFTGPQGYLNIEPYYELATDKMDLSQYRNWRKTDMCYGANINFIYYIHNNLSPESRSRFMNRRKESNSLSADSVPQSWRAPWFAEFSKGINMVKSPSLGAGQTMGHETSVALGKWLSPAIGLRATVSMRSATWQKETVEAQEGGDMRPARERQWHSVYGGVRVDALLNPLGLNRNYRWESRFGFYLVGGIEMGRIMKYQHKHLSCRSETYSGGLHLWANLGGGVQLFVEPRYSHYVYKIPYSNVDWNKRFSDNGYTISAGLTVTHREQRFRNTTETAAANGEDTPATLLNRLTFGLGGGTSLITTKGGYAGNKGLTPAGQAFAQYTFSPLTAARLTFELTSAKGSSEERFADYNLDAMGEGYSPVYRRGLWTHSYTLGLVSAQFAFNLSHALYGYNAGRTFSVELLAGPTLTMAMSRKSELGADERLQAGHRCVLANSYNSQTAIGANAGAKLNARINSHIGLFLSPTIYFLGNIDLPGLQLLKTKHIETINLGVQYTL